MAKRTRKLTEKVKAHLLANRWRVRKDNYTGEALAYLLRIRTAAKTAKKKVSTTAKIGSATIAKNSDLYKTIEAAAKAKGQTVAKFIKENKEDILELMQGQRLIMQRETSYAIDDITSLSKKSKIRLNGRVVSKGDATYSMQTLTSTSMMVSNIVVVFYDMMYDLTGNLYIEFPEPDDYADIVSGLDNDSGDSDSSERWKEYLDQFDHVTYIAS